MATLVRWDPFREVEALHNELSRRMNGLGEGNGRQAQPWVPALDVWETDQEIVYELDLPGVSQDQISVEVDDATLTVSATREREQGADGFGRFERRVGTFTRTVGLPSGIAQDAIAARHADGVLRVTIPKPEQPKPKQITINSDPTTGKQSEIEGTSRRK